MAEHIFLQRKQIEPADIHEVLDLTVSGQLEWYRSYTALAIGTNVNYSMGSEVGIARNLLEVRVGHNPGETLKLNYLRMTDASRELYYVDEESDDGLIVLANRVLRIGNIALTVPGGRLSGTLEECESCERETGHLALYDSPYGLSGAMMAGSARTECASCGVSVRIEQEV